MLEISAMSMCKKLFAAHRDQEEDKANTLLQLTRHQQQGDERLHGKFAPPYQNAHLICPVKLIAAGESQIKSPGEYEIKSYSGYRYSAESISHTLGYTIRFALRLQDIEVCLAAWD